MNSAGSQLERSAPAPAAPPIARDQGWEAAGPGSGEALLAIYWSLVRRYLWSIMAVVILVTAAVALFSLTRPKEYEAAAVIRVDPAGEQTIGSTQQSEVSVNVLELMTTEASLVTNPAVVRQVIREAGLTADPEFNPAAKAQGGAAVAGDAGISDTTMRLVTAAISVSQPANTFLLNVSFRSRSPQLSARVANLLVAAFEDREYETRATALQASTRNMSKQMDALGAEMEASQQALVNYESRYDVLNPDDKTNVMQARLSQLNEAYSKAQVARVAKQADYDVVRSGNLDALLTTDRGVTLGPMQKQLEADRRQLARLAEVYGPNYPVYQQQEQLVAADRNMLTRAEQHVAAQIADQYKTLRSQERLLGGLLQQQKAAMDEFNRKAIRYHDLKAKADSLSNLYYGLQQRIQDATVGAGLRSEDLRVISSAVPNTRPVYPRPVLATVLAALLSSLLGAGAAILVGVLDRRISSEEEAERWLGVPTIGTLPLVQLKGGNLSLALREGDSGAGLTGPGDQAAGFREAVLSFRSTLQFAAADRAPVIAVCSSIPGEGKSTISASLARALAALGERVVLVDGDLRKSNVHRQFGVANRCGLADVLQRKRPLGDALVASGVDNLTLLPAGPSTTAAPQLLHLRMEGVLTELRESFDQVVIDCPPILGFADTQTIAALANGIVLVVRASFADRRHVRAAVRQLQNAGANVLGVVLNGVSGRQHSYYSYYATNYYSHYRPESEQDVAL